MTAPTPWCLYHFTCSHSVQAIRESGIIRPNPHGPLALAWFTDLAAADRQGLGLTSLTLHCDRTEHRFTVAPVEPILWWPDWCHTHRLGRRERDVFEGSPGAQPGHWWVSDQPAEVIR